MNDNGLKQIMKEFTKITKNSKTLIDTLKWLNVRERLQVNTIYFIRKMKIGDVPDYLTEQLRYVGEVQP